MEQKIMSNPAASSEKDLSLDAVEEVVVLHKYESGPSMKKQFGTIATLGVAFSVMNPWTAEAALLTLFVGLGGSVTIIWGCVAAAFFVAAMCAGLAELASAFPGAGGPYHYTFMVASAKNRKLLSFLSGWSVTIAWWFGNSGTCLFAADFLQGIVVFWHPDYTPTTWQTWLIFVALIVVCTAISIGLNAILSLITSLSLFWTVAGFFVTIITTVAMHQGQPYESASDVFGSFTNDSGWSSAGLAFVIGWMLSTTCFLGLDAVTHFSEEMDRPGIQVPRAMVGALTIGLATAFCVLITLLFCITDFEAVEKTPTGVPVLAIFYQATGSKAAATALTLIIFMSLVFAVITGTAVAGRTTWAFARDNGTPFPQYLGHIDETSHLPLRATLLSSVLAICLGAIYIGSSAGFNALVGSLVIMLFIPYALPQAILVFRGRHHLPPRPFNLGKAGIFFNILAPILVLFSLVFLCLPVELPVTPMNMNYLSVVVAGCWTLVFSYYIAVKKGQYEGPILEPSVITA